MIAESPAPSVLDPRQAFQQLKTRLHRQMVDAIDLSKAGQLPERDLRSQLRSLATHLCGQQAVNLPPDDREAMVREIMDEIYGFGPIEPLMNDPEVSDVLINGPDSVFIERNGLLERTDIRFASNEHLIHFIQRLVGRAGRRIDEVSPMVDCQTARRLASERGHSAARAAWPDGLDSPVQVEGDLVRGHGSHRHPDARNGRLHGRLRARPH